MNIFFLSKNTKTCAKFHVDRHVVKMILEYSQLLSTAHRVLEGVEIIEKSPSGRMTKRLKLNDHRDVILYKDTHINHPSAIWVRKSSANYIWLHKLLVELCKEYTYRYGKIHKCQSSGLVECLSNVPTYSTNIFTEPTPAMPDDVKIVNDSIASYRNYYKKNKLHLAKWSGKINSRPVPYWFVS